VRNHKVTMKGKEKHDVNNHEVIVKASGEGGLGRGEGKNKLKNREGTI
jgi:hypothetical protein